jgi:hypothetical protein
MTSVPVRPTYFSGKSGFFHLCGAAYQIKRLVCVFSTNCQDSDSGFVLLAPGKCRPRPVHFIVKEPQLEASCAQHMLSLLSCP